MLRFAPFLLIPLLPGCPDAPTETVSLCLPAGSDCEAFLSRNAAELATPERGDQVYQAQCASCHGKDGKGMGVPGRGDFTSPDWQKKWTDGDLDGIISAGRGVKMPAFRLGAVDLRSVVLFVRTLDSSRGRSDAAIPAPVGQGPYDPKTAEPR